MMLLLLILLPMCLQAATIPDAVLGVDLDAPLQDQYLTGDALPLAGTIRDGVKAGGQILFNFAPRSGQDPVQLFIELQGNMFAGYQIFRHDQAGTYDLKVFLGGPGETRLGFVGGYEGLEIGQGGGAIRLPEDFFPGLLLDAPFAVEFSSGEELVLAGKILDPLKEDGQLLWVFEPLDGGEEKRFYLPLRGDRFKGHQVFRHQESGQYQLSLYLGGVGEGILGYVGGFAVEVRRGSGEVFIPRGYFSDLLLDQPLPERLPIGVPVFWSGQVEPQVRSLRVEIKGAETRVLSLGLEKGRFSTPLRLREDELGALLLRVVVEHLDGRFVLAGEFPVQGVKVPVPHLVVGALALGLRPGEEGSLRLTNDGQAELKRLNYQLEGPFALAGGPLTLAAGASAELRLRPRGNEQAEGVLTIQSDDPEQPQVVVALKGLGEADPPIEIRTLPLDAGGRFSVQLGAEDQLLVLYSAQMSEVDTGAVYVFTLGSGLAKAALPPPAPTLSPRDLREGELRQQERILAQGLRLRALPARKVSATLPRAGDQRRFVFPALGGVRQQEVAASLVAISGRALAWVQEGTSGPDQGLVEQLLRQFSDEDETLVGQRFGLPSDVDGDGRVSFLFTPLVDQVGWLAGFYSAASTLSRDLGGTGDQVDLMFLSPTQPADSYRSLLVHEFQHLVNFNQHVLVRHGEGEANWLNEGLSHLAEDLVSGYIASGQGEIIAAFLEAPGEVGLAGEALMDRRKRGAAYLFVRSLADRMGAGVLLRLVNTGLADRDNVEAATGESFAQLLACWGAEVYLSGLGLYPHPRFEYISDLLRAGEGRGFPLPAILEYRPGGAALQGSLRPRGLTWVRLHGPGTAEGQVTAGAKIQGLLIPLPEGFEARVQVPADYVPGVHFTRLLPGRYLVGQDYQVEGEITAAGQREVLIRFAGEDTLRYFPAVEEGRFSQLVRFTADQVGTYALEVFLGSGDGHFEGVGTFSPVEVVAPAAPTGVEEGPKIPQSFTLGPAYPNPFNGAVLIPVEVPGAAGEVELSVYNILGQRVRLLFRGNLTPGRHLLTWDGRDDHGREVGTGGYLFRAVWQDRVQVQRGVLLL
ncbi:MAG: hypothetical protein EXS58_08675 [Candidatus Latescibacteria bacterium]|nr:hypothetical protein [Candidatus Latescibacterota bacterium]